MMADPPEGVGDGQALRCATVVVRWAAVTARTDRFCSSARARRLRRSSMLVGSSFVLALASVAAPHAGGVVSTATASTIDLDGMWDFETQQDEGAPEPEPQQQGVAHLDRKPRLASQMRVPGAWQAGASGPGVETRLLRHQFSGQAWYRKSVDISAKPEGASCWLWLGGAPGGVMRSARVYAGQQDAGSTLNSTLVGRHVGYLDPVEMELPCAGAGNSLSISVLVDNRWNVTEDPLWGAGSWWNKPSAGCLPGGGKAPEVNGTATCSGGDGYSFGGYGGIVGHARLLFRQPAWVDDSVHVRSAPSGAGSADWVSTLSFAVAGAAATPGLMATVEVCSWNNRSLPCARSTVSAAAAAGARIEVPLAIKDARLWWPGTPGAAVANLYTANVTLSNGASRSIRYGIKQMTMEGSSIIMNGERLYLRGYGDDGMYATTAAPPAERGYYEKTLRNMKDLGFNFIRFHTHNMPEEFFDVADELGMMSDPEFAMNYDFPCDVNGCSADNELTRATINRSFTSNVHRQSHRPSIFGRALSNEIAFTRAGAGGNSGLKNNMFAYMYLTSKTFDPERPVWFSDGADFSMPSPEGLSNLKCHAYDVQPGDNTSCAVGSECLYQRCFQDVLVAQAGWSHVQSWYGVDKGSGLPASLPVPSLLHEAVDARNFPRLEVNAESYANSNIKGDELWYAQSIEKMRSLGLLEENAAWSTASERYYTQVLKTFFENYHLDGTTSGYELWLTWDWFAASNGMVGGHQNEPRPKPGISNATIRSVQREIMILTPNPLALQSAAYAPGQTVSIELLLQNMSFAGFPSWNLRSSSPTVSWSATLGGKVVASHSAPLDSGSIPQGKTGSIGNATFKIPESIRQGGGYQRLVLAATVQLEQAWNTSWTLGVFPTPAPPKQCDFGLGSATLVADAAMLPAAKLHCSNARSTVPPAGEPFVFVGRSLNASMAAALSRPGCFALLIDPAGGFPSCESGGIGSVPAPTTVSAGLPWWMNAGFVGSLVYNSSLWSVPAAHELVELSYLPFEFTSVNAGSAWVLDNATKAANVVTHVRAIPADGAYGATVMVNSIPYTSLIKDYALVFEADLPAPSTARVLVSGLNIMASNGLPGVGPGRWVFDTLLSYALSNSTLRSQTTAGSSVSKSLKGDSARAMAVTPPAAFCGAGPSAGFCRVDEEAACASKFASSTVGTCNGNFTIVQPVTLADVASVTALNIKLQANSAGSMVIPLLFDGASGKPGKLIAKGKAAPLAVGKAPAHGPHPCPATFPFPTHEPPPYKGVICYKTQAEAASGEGACGSWCTMDVSIGAGCGANNGRICPASPWLSLPLEAPSLAPGRYYIGALYSADTSCWAGPGAKDSYARQPYADGPVSGTALSWTTGTASIAAYAVTA
jgi:hypothetical protein